MERERLPANTLIDSVLSLFVGDDTQPRTTTMPSVSSTSQKLPKETTSQKPDLTTVTQSKTPTSNVKSAEKSNVTPTVTIALTGVPTSKTSVTSAVPTSAQKNTIDAANNTPLVTTKDPTTASATVSTNPKNMSSQNPINDSPPSRIPTTPSVTTGSVTTKEGDQIISTSPYPNITRGISPTLSSSTTLESTQQPSRGCNTVASNHKLVEVLCQAVKPSFNKTQDECHIEIALGSRAQEVDIKHITIITKLHPTDIYKLLKDDWDKLEDVGIRDMQFEGQGPPEEMEDRFSMPLIITIVCMASFLLLVAALYGCCHQRLSHRKDQQRLTEELQTVENGYHDNPTLEVMETSSEMQEKKVANLNGELGDSWIVPLDNLTKDDPEEEDTHL
ncbi:hypothetical protein Celaphus_00012262 [Cervus elaphus hippelaphus]|uniref:Podocalyxin n=1 Tax=Cervus elaphus hippelaphus TaxID=46360 RepID=A0A212CLD5_CEREH|nr:hypothetical protein Celaphus_00012262 [Cervus elaphus hippelaphus]